MDESSGDMQDPETIFRAIRANILEDYERDLERRRAEWEHQRAVNGRVGARSRELLQRGGFDLKGAEALIEAERREMEKYVEEARSRVTGLAPPRAGRLRAEAERALGLIQDGWSQAFLFGADAMGEASEAPEGEAGNPATWLYDANQQWKGKTSISGKVDSCTGVWPYHPASRIWYFTWPSGFVGPCSVSVFVGYYGAKYLYGFSLPFLYCGTAGVSGKAELNVYQQVGYPKYSKLLGYDHATIINETATNTASAGRVDGYQWLSAAVNITSTSQLYMSVYVGFEVFAAGPVSYAELDFQAGSNYVLPPIVAIKSATP